MVGSQTNTLAPPTFVKVTAVSNFVFSFNTVAPVVSEESVSLENWPSNQINQKVLFKVILLCMLYN
jgi:hypothetical protein